MGRDMIPELIQRLPEEEQLRTCLNIAVVRDFLKSKYTIEEISEGIRNALEHSGFVTIWIVEQWIQLSKMEGWNEFQPCGFDWQDN